jgi:hemerythrin-like domain-containing protein
MSDLLALWHGEHAKFSRLLDLLEAQVRVFHDGDQPDFEMMGDIVRYLTEYADAFHHPREDAGFALLKKKDPSMTTRLNRLMQEHRVLAEAGRQLLVRLEAMSADLLVPRRDIEAAAATYLIYFRQHIDFEESEVLPRIARLFTAADWAEVSKAKAHGTDPLFGPRVDARFVALRRRIAEEVAAHTNGA